ncbi:hypothetical protein ABIB50_003883 [Mucilaginibacter sp. UYCu711]
MIELAEVKLTNNHLSNKIKCLNWLIDKSLMLTRAVTASKS